MSAELTNYLGTGTNPCLRLTLGDNQAKWNPYIIDYAHAGNLPDGWSTWNVTDIDNNYYGTITLTSDGKNIIWNKYVAGKDGYYLDGVNLKNGQLTVNKIYQNPSHAAGPFPDAPVAQPAVYTGTKKPITLRVEGDKILDDFGRNIKLKGMVRPSLEWDAQGQFLSSLDITNIAKWGSNVIRLDLNQDFWFKSQPASVKGSYKQIIDAIIYYATQNEMAVILDLHWLDSKLQQAPMADNKSLDFWAEVASTYKNFGTVIFELYNEPYGVSKNAWLGGDGVVVGFQELYDAVRTAGANNLVIINGLDYGYDISFVNPNFSVKGSNIVYGSHPYDTKGAPGYTGQGGSLEQNFQGVLGKYPLIFTEFGDNIPGDYPFHYLEVYQRNLAFIKQHNLHYTGFAWWVEAANPAFPCMIADWNGTPLNGGILVKEDMQQYPATKFFQQPALLMEYRQQFTQPIHPLATYIVPHLIKQQDQCSQQSEIFEVIRSCLNFMLNTKSDTDSKKIVHLLEEKCETIKQLERSQRCWPFGFFTTTPIYNQLDTLLKEVKSQLDLLPRNQR